MFCAATVPEVPVTVMVYIPAGVPPVLPPPPVEDELPPQLAENNRPDIRSMSSKRAFFLRGDRLAPSRVIPMGSNIA